MDLVDLLVALAIVVGLVGIVVPVLPGVLLIAVALIVWGVDEGSTSGWIWTGLALAVLVVGQVVKYLIPGRQLKRDGIPTTSILAGGLLGIVGFFLIPVLGLFLGFIGGVYLAELNRLGSRDAAPDGGGYRAAWPSTWAATRAVGLSILIELASALIATTAWIIALLTR